MTCKTKTLQPGVGSTTLCLNCSDIMAVSITLMRTYFSDSIWSLSQNVSLQVILNWWYSHVTHLISVLTCQNMDENLTSSETESMLSHWLACKCAVNFIQKKSSLPPDVSRCLLSPPVMYFQACAAAISMASLSLGISSSSLVFKTLKTCLGWGQTTEDSVLYQKLQLQSVC